jgi:hypothetical protein
MGCCKTKEKKHPTEQGETKQTKGYNTVHPDNQTLLGSINDPSTKNATKGNTTTPSHDVKNDQAR